MKATSKRILGAAVVAAIVVFGFAVTYVAPSFVPHSNGNRAVLSSEFRNGTADGLRLGLQVTPHGNGSMGIRVEENNTMSVDQTVQAADAWALPPASLNPFDSCGSIPALPIGVAVFQGRYSLANYSTANSLVLYNTSYAFTCTTNLHPVTEYVFIASGYKATAIDSRSQAFDVENVTLSISVTGYWTGGAGTSQPATLHPFHGDYTVLAADEWGGVILAHFAVG